MQMAGLLIDVYGLSELPPTATHISCLWLHHPRTKSKETMGDFAARCVAAWYSSEGGGGAQQQDHPGSRSRGLVALAYDQRNHGSRAVDEKANGSWREGNAMHAVDMFGVVAGMVADQRVLLYVVIILMAFFLLVLSSFFLFLFFAFLFPFIFPFSFVFFSLSFFLEYLR
jgi:hypothetical protein